MQISYLHKHLAQNTKLHIAVVFSVKLALVAAKNILSNEIKSNCLCEVARTAGEQR